MISPEPERGWLTWALRPSLISYVQRSGGAVSYGAPATWTDDGFRFPAMSDGPLRFAGEASLRAHGGLLAVDLVDPQVEDDRGRLLLTVSNLARNRRTAFAELVETERDPKRTALSTRLTAAASEILGGVYPVGAEFEPLFLVRGDPA